jgi:hypothetical protein
MKFPHTHSEGHEASLSPWSQVPFPQKQSAPQLLVLSHSAVTFSQTPLPHGLETAHTATASVQQSPLMTQQLSQ